MASPFLRVSRTLPGPLRSSIRPRSAAAPPRPNNHTRASSSSTSSTTTTTTSSSSSSDAAQPAASLAPILYTTAGILLLGGTYLYATDTRAAIHRWLVPPLLRLCFPDAEDAHDFGTATLKALYSLSLHPRERNLFPSSSSSGGDIPLSVTDFGTELANPLGISAGLDKHADIPDALFDLGAAVVEVGGCTALPQAGNARPRVFRLPSLDGMINRYGLNSRGADVMAIQLRERVRKFALSRGLSLDAVLDGKAGVPPGSLRPGKLLAVQVAKNKDTDERDVLAVARDYVYCVRRLAPYADVLVVNVSSPNTPGLRDLQAVEPLSRILAAVVKEAQRTPRASKPKVMVKVSPDEDEDAQMEGIVQAVWMSGVDGVIVGNTTKRRTGVVPDGLNLTAREANTLQETGGFSGPKMFDRTLSLVGRYRKMLDGVYVKAEEAAAAHKVESPEQKVVFATGGITNGEQALKILNAGASIAMVYTALVYGGAGTITRMKSEMREKLMEEKKQ